MRTSLRAAIAITVAPGALIVASMASAAPLVQEVVSPTTSVSGGGSSMPGASGMTCTVDQPDCNDSGLGGSLSDCPTDPASTEPESPASSCVTDPTGGPEPTPSMVEPTAGM